jgi:hypothetical protein
MTMFSLLPLYSLVQLTSPLTYSPVLSPVQSGLLPLRSQFVSQTSPQWSRQAVEEPVPFDVLPPQEAVQTQEIRPLSGKLDTIPVFNSNSPELVQTEGILLSTFPPTDKRFPAAHLNFPFQGRFDIFAHHIAKAQTQSQARTVFLGIILNNPGTQFVSVDVLQGASYLTQDAIYVDLPPYVDDPLGRVFSGPGSRTMSDVFKWAFNTDALDQ